MIEVTVVEISVTVVGVVIVVLPVTVTVPVAAVNVVVVVYVAGVTVVKKYEEQSAVPLLVLNAEAITALKQLLWEQPRATKASGGLKATAATPCKDNTP